MCYCEPLHGLAVISVNGERSDGILPVPVKKRDVAIRRADCEPLPGAVSDDEVHVDHESVILSLCTSDFEVDRDLESPLHNPLRDGHFEEG